MFGNPNLLSTHPSALPPQVEHWIVVNVQFPDYAPPNPVFGKARNDGPGFSLVMYAPITPELWAQCKQVSPHPYPGTPATWSKPKV